MSANRPILFNDETVRAILDGRKTVTRRVVKLQHGADVVVTDGQVWRPSRTDYDGYVSCPFGKPGDRLWVREAWGVAESRFAPRGCTIRYRADGATGEVAGESGLKYAGKDMSFCWRPSIHMPRWASRLTLEITDIRCQRLQDISEEDAQAEGVQWNARMLPFSVYFRDLWDSIAKPGALWSDNPWVWAIRFQRVEV